MTEDKPPEDAEAVTAEADLLRQAAREIRASRSLEALVPLSPSEREQLADAAIDRALGSALGASSTPSPGEPAAPPAGVTPLRPRSRGRTVAAVVVATAALAAALVLYLRTGTPPVEPLAGYAMVVEGERRTRGAAEPASGEPVELRPETRLVVTLTPTRTERDALVRLVVVRDRRATVLDPPIARLRAGGLEIAGPAAELLGAQRDGPAELVVVLGRALPGDDEIRGVALGGAAPAWRHLQVLRRAVVLAGFSHTAIDVLLGGCSAVLEPHTARAGPVRCEVASGARLHLWVGAPVTAGIAIRIDEHAIASGAEPRGGGAGFDLEVPAPAGLLAVAVDGQDIAAWQLAPAASFAEVRASDEARKAGRLDDAVAELDAVAPETAARGASPVSAEVSPEVSPEERLEVLRRRAKIDRLRGDPGRERERRDQAVALARSLGRVSVASDETVAIVYGLMDQHALAQAVQLLPALDAHGTRYAEGAVHRELVRGMLASELGDLGAALEAFQRALAIAERIADHADRAMILGPLADVLQSLGRGGEAAALIDAEIQRGARDTDVCARVDALTNAGWLLRDLDLPRAQQLADQAAELAAQRCALRAPIALVNQGWLLAAAGRFRAARAVVDRLARVPHTDDGRVATWALRLEAETVLGEDPAAAERAARTLAARAAALCSTELAYEAHLLRARALVRLDHPDRAAAAFADAERALGLWSRLVPLGEGRETFFERHDQLALSAIPFFLAQIARGKAGARVALAATVRHSIARFVGSLAGGGRARALAERGESVRDRTSRQFERTRARWPARLSDAPPGDAVAGVCEARDAAALAGAEPALTEAPAHAALLVHPSPNGLLIVAWRRSAVEVAEVPRAATGEGRGELAARIARTAAPMLAGAPRVHLHVHRSLAALPLDRSLAAALAVPVAFAVDVPARPPAARCTGAPRALLVVDPQRNLWAASAAVQAIGGDLVRRGFAVDTLEGTAATRAAVEARLADPCTALFEYDGHGVAAAARADRTGDALILAGDDTLTAVDVLGLARVPPAVVLNGCTTAAPEGLGLAQAFLLDGAAQVIASLDDIPAADAARFTRTLFAAAPSITPSVAPPRAGALDLVPLFARAIAGRDAMALRVFER